MSFRRTSAGHWVSPQNSLPLNRWLSSYGWSRDPNIIPKSGISSAFTSGWGILGTCRSHPDFLVYYMELTYDGAPRDSLNANLYASLWKSFSGCEGVVDMHNWCHAFNLCIFFISSSSACNQLTHSIVVFPCLALTHHLLTLPHLDSLLIVDWSAELAAWVEIHSDQYIICSHHFKSRCSTWCILQWPSPSCLSLRLIIFFQWSEFTIPICYLLPECLAWKCVVGRLFCLARETIAKGFPCRLLVPTETCHALRDSFPMCFFGSSSYLNSHHSYAVFQLEPLRPGDLNTAFMQANWHYSWDLCDIA